MKKIKEGAVHGLKAVAVLFLSVKLKCIIKKIKSALLKGGMERGGNYVMDIFKSSR